ncbi:CAMK family protein kinase [Tritrichomonas foetus]|uniref:CAMK family protein kinase n=1 Tax=Tritrichomonas foetus TaxID=1144522 RepID=A0A1J4KRL3_9EUKA|nr:CAMK family protein kinase [Tritrichomonas foetus]|eukprot:OHT13568.1 CAMK family protein kinase [Tritrichomonas foetus]
MTMLEVTEHGAEVRIPLNFKQYTMEKVIGVGALSVVCLVRDTILNQRYAAKIVNRQTLVDYNCMKYFEREIRLMQSINHPNIIHVVEIVYLTDVIVVVMDYCANGDLLTFLIQKGRLLPNLQKRLFFQIANAVNYLHSKNYAHRDLKLENIFIDSNCNAKLGDFGLTIETNDNSLLSTFCGTMYYAAPEVLMLQKYDGKKSDIWSLGIVLYSMSTGTLPWSATTPNDVKEEVCKGEYLLPESIPRYVAQIIEGCLRVNPADRICIKDILNSPWLKQEVEQARKLARAPATRSLNTPHFAISNSQSLKTTGKLLTRPVRMVNSEIQKLDDLYTAK